MSEVYYEHVADSPEWFHLDELMGAELSPHGKGGPGDGCFLLGKGDRVKIVVERAPRSAAKESRNVREHA